MNSQLVEQGVKLAAEGGTPAAIKVFVLLTVLTFLPALLISITSFARIIVVLSFLRQALGTQQAPPNQVLLGLSLFLTLFVMGPTLSNVWDAAAEPFLDDKIEWKEALEKAEGPLSTFMLGQTAEEDLVFFHRMSGLPAPKRGESVPFRVLVPAFMISELSAGFAIGLRLFIPLLLIDLFVAAILMSLGMMMVPPSMVSLPLKLGVFVMADGWRLVVGGLVESFGA